MGKEMARRAVKLVAIGNSKGIRLQKGLLRKYGWGESLVLEEMDGGVFLYSEAPTKVSWEETYRAMAAEKEDWGDFDTTAGDGLD